MPGLRQHHLTSRGGKVLLACGVASSALYVFGDVVGALRYDGYSYTSQTISELSAIGAPSRSFAVPMGIAYDVLLIAFGFGVWRSAGARRSLRVATAGLVGFGITGLMAPFVPMHQREVLAADGRSLTDVMHLTLASANVFFILLITGFGAAALERRFRAYSIATIVVVVVFGVMTSMYAPQVEANEPTRWAGVTERISAFAFMLWTMALAIALLREDGTGAAATAEAPSATRPAAAG